MYLYLFPRKPLCMSRPFYLHVCTVLVKPILAISCRFLHIYYILIKYLKPCEVYLEHFACIYITDTKVFLLFVTITFSSFKDTLLQIWKSPYMFVFPEISPWNFTFLILKILKLVECKVSKMLVYKHTETKKCVKK